MIASMKKTTNEIKLLRKVALVTSPIIAIMLVTPVFLVIHIDPFHFQFIFPLVILFVFAGWVIHIRLIKHFQQKMKWLRFVLPSIIMIVASSLFYLFAQRLFPIHGWEFHAVRIVNILSINGIIYIISNYTLLSQTKKKLDIENEQLKFANLEARFQVLQNQINPHFLFNSIGTAKSLIRKNPSIADEYLVKLSDFLRLGFNAKMDIITVKEELVLCEDYIALQKMRFDDALLFEVHVREKYFSYHIPYFALLILVENAVKHNSMTEEEPLRIIITDNAQDQLIIENQTRKKFLLETSSKIGLHNLSERYRLLFNEPIRIEEGYGMFRVTIKMIRK